MNTATLTALITSVTAFIGAVTGLVIAIQHIRNHASDSSAKAPDSTVGPSPARPVDRGPTL